MELHAIDWFFVAGYCVLAFGIGLYFSRRAATSMEEFFAAGRSLPWWVAGTSIVATTFAVDTPLLVSGLVRSQGIYANWMWWNILLGGMFSAWFYARLWRRAEVLTDVELIELRYAGPSARALRVFMVCFNGLLKNGIVMGWVMLAMVKLCEVMLGWRPTVAIPVLVAVALVYTVLSGFWGVVMTDLVQFAMAMVGSIALAVIVVGKVGGPSAMVEQVREAPAAPAHVFDFVPDFTEATGLVVFGFLVQISMQWWQQAQGDGYIVQRLASTRSEKDSFLALLWFNFAHYVLRPWPWILVGLASIILWPITAGEDPELAYPRMIADHLPAGLKGLMVASLLAAFMSTMDTQLNWGASYLVNDVYRRFLVRDADARHYVLASRVAILLLMGLAAFVAWQLETIEQAWFLVFLLGSGLATVWMLRWFWWRVNAWCEIAALATSLLIAFGGPLLDVLHAGGLLPDAAHQGVAWFYSGDAYYVRLVTNLAVATAVWVTVALVTRPVAAERLGAFYRKVRPGGWWGPVAAAHPDIVRQDLRGALLGWVSGSACIYAGLFGVGNLCLARWGAAVVALAVAGAAGAVVLWVASRREQGGEGPTRASGNAGNR